MSTQADFWGDVVQSEGRTPVAVLREQATLLGGKTQNVIEAKVDTEVSGRSFRHSFSLVVPALDNYTYQLFVIQHGVNLYPVTVQNPYQELKTEEEFIDWLRQRLSSAETKKIIGNLLAQANS
jgi:hypothetical protein